MRKFIGWLCYFIATGFFTGRLGRNGKGGGTWGSILALLIQFLLVFWIQPVWWVYPVITVAIFALGLAVVGPAEQYAYERYGEVPRHDGKIGMYDRNETNIDEVFGMFAANCIFLIIFSTVDLQNTWNMVGAGTALGIGFVGFRLFDVFKRGPARQMECNSDPENPFGMVTRLSIMLDDLFAALPLVFASSVVLVGIYCICASILLGIVLLFVALVYDLV